MSQKKGFESYAKHIHVFLIFPLLANYSPKTTLKLITKKMELESPQFQMTL